MRICSVKSTCSLFLLGLIKGVTINPVVLNIVGDEFKPIEYFTLNPEGYEELYKQVLIHKNIPHFIGPLPLKKGIERYIHYLKEDSELINYIQEHENIPEEELMIALIKNFTEYGLGDVQYLEIIKAARKIVYE